MFSMCCGNGNELKGNLVQRVELLHSTFSKSQAFKAKCCALCRLKLTVLQRQCLHILAVQVDHLLICT